MKSKNVLITGIAGFIGSHVAKHCLRLGFNVIGVDDLSGGFKENIPTGVIFYKGSICNKKLIGKIFKEYKINYVYHLAAYAAEGLSHFIRNFNYNNNVIGSINLINESILNEIECFVFTSSIAVYGAGQLPMTENTIPEPEDPYGIAKYSIELDLKAAKKMFGLNNIIFRPHNVYGENQNIKDKYRNVIGIFMNQAMKKEPMTIFGDGLQTRAFSYIDDVAPIIAESTLNNCCYNEVFNIGADKPYTVLELAEKISDIFKVKKNIKFLEPRKEVVHAYSDHSKLKKFFNKNNYTDLTSGLEKMANWAIKNKNMKQINFNKIEIEKNLPNSWRIV